MMVENNKVSLVEKAREYNRLMQQLGVGGATNDLIEELCKEIERLTKKLKKANKLWYKLFPKRNATRDGVNKEIFTQIDKALEIY